MKQSDFDLSKDEWECLIEQWIFNEEDRAILRRRFFYRTPIEQMAEEFNLSYDQMKKRLYKAQNILFKHI